MFAFPRQRIVLLVFAAGAAFTVYLQTLTRPVVFYSCDGGLKYIWTRQFARQGLGSLALNLDPAAPKWVDDLWQTGLFPFEPPFVYPRSGQQFVNYQPFFCLASAIFYKAVNWHGLYILPIVSMWLLWWSFAAACRRQGIGPIATAASLAALVFATPLTLYSAMFWEHVPALALAMLTLFRLADPAPRETLRSGALVALPLALSAFLRPELLMAGCAAAGFIWLFRALGWSTRRKLGFTLTIALATIGWIGWNLVVTGGLLGFHGEQLPTGIDVRLRGAPAVMHSYWTMLRDTCPMSVLGVLLIVVGLLRRDKSPAAAADRIGLLLCLLLFVGLPMIFPNEGGKQWGPRYLLLWVPALSLVIARWLHDEITSPLYIRAATVSERGAYHCEGPFERDDPRPLTVAALKKPIIIALFALAAIWGSFVNTYQGSQNLAVDYARRIFPISQVIHAAPQRVVMTNTQFLAMEWTDTFRDHWWFLATTDQARTRLVQSMAAAGQRQFLIIAQGWPSTMPPVIINTPRGPVTVRVQMRLDGGPIKIYDADITEGN